jgi:DNA-binding MarR family transcriptional regulator
MNLENSILPNLGQTAKVLDLMIEDKLYAEGIPLSKLQFVFLRIISGNNEQPQSNLAELTGRDKTTFTRNIKTLERKELVVRIPSSTDKRVKLVCITTKGKELVAKAMPFIEEMVTEVEAELTDEERSVFLETLNKIKNKLIEVRTKNNKK